MAVSRIVWSELLFASEHVIMEYLESLDGIPQYAYSVLTSYLQAGCLISSTLLNELEIEPMFWSQFDDIEDEFDMNVTYNSDELTELSNDDNYDLSFSAINDLVQFNDYDCIELHENYDDDTVLRASSDSDMPAPRTTRASRSVSRTTVTNRTSRAARSHTPTLSRHNMPPPQIPLAPRRGRPSSASRAATASRVGGSRGAVKKTTHPDNVQTTPSPLPPIFTL